MWTAFGIMLGYVSGVVLHNVAGSGAGFEASVQTDTGRLQLIHQCPVGSGTADLLHLSCVSRYIHYLPRQLTDRNHRAGIGD